MDSDGFLLALAQLALVSLLNLLGDSEHRLVRQHDNNGNLVRGGKPVHQGPADSVLHQLP